MRQFQLASDARRGAKDRLLRCTKKRFDTSLIGALSRFEEFFGHLWGHGKDHSDRTELQKQWFEIWSECRAAILDNGNNQMRNLEKEITQTDNRK